MTIYVQRVLIVVALALKKMKISLSVLIVAWGRIRQVSTRQVLDNYKKMALFSLSLFLVRS
jgi:cbb3-type cytochrome oxidase subunit 1